MGKKFLVQTFKIERCSVLHKFKKILRSFRKSNMGTRREIYSRDHCTMIAGDNRMARVAGEKVLNFKNQNY